jgi:hypothetical protein
MITDRDYLRAEAQYLTPPDALRDDHAQCARCRCMSSDLDDDGACPGCADTDDSAELAEIAEGIALLNADVALAKLAAQWQSRSGLRTYAHLVSVEMARLDAVHGDALGDGWVSL